MISRRWNILAYAILLTVLAMALGYVFLSKSDVLLENLSMQEYDARLSRNLSAKADLALNWESSLNADGAGFVAARECPPTVSMSGTVSGSTLETVAVAPAIRDGRLVCEGASANATLLRLYYSSDYSTFLTGSYVNDVNINPSGSGTELSGTFADPEGKYLSFALPSGFSPYDRDLNSDDYRTGSTGSVAYPDGYSDNDARARKTAIGLVRNDAGWYAAFWNDPKSDAVIEKNSNNGDSLSAKLPSVSAGYLHFEIDRPFSIRVVEFDSGSYLATGELHRISSEESSSSTGAVGYLQNDLTFSGSRSPGDNARAFDFQNRDYAVFLSYPKESAGWSAYLKYKISGENASGSGLYLVPIDDSLDATIQYVASDIVIDSKGNYRSKTLTFSSPKTGTGE